MRTLAQLCLRLFGFSDIADAIKAERDLHVEMATETLGGMTYEQAFAAYVAGDKIVEDIRQGSKIANYGMAGGMGPDTFIDYARGYDVEVSRDRAVELHGAFRRRWREMVRYFQYVSDLIGDDSSAKNVVHPITGMVRGDVMYSALANHGFQHLAAVGATDALFCVVEECFVPGVLDGEDSPLYGCRPWLFNHDEIGMEIPVAVIGAEHAHAAAMRLQAVMIERMSAWCPNVPIGATVAMARRWHKGAKPLLENGLLVPVKPIKDEKGKTKWIHDEDDTQGAYVPQQEERLAA
jgi:hypothetical protein